jgi:hypothetical protein
MGMLGSFMGKFGGTSEVEPPLSELVPQSGGLDKFLTKFQVPTMESFWFYDHTIELRFEPVGHVYYKVGPLGELAAQNNASSVCHIIERPALVPWTAKVTIEKLLRTVPTFSKEMPCSTVPVKGPGGALEVGPTYPVVYIPEMSLEDFTKIALEAKSAHSDVLDDASDVGHMAHTWLEFYIRALIAGHTLEAESKLLNMPKDERAANCVRAALDWMKKHNVRWIETERKLYSKKYECAGTTDGLCRVDSCTDPLCQGCHGEQFKDKLCIIDWKSSNYLYIEYLFQSAFYQQAYQEEFSVDIDERWVLRLGNEDGEFDPWRLTATDFQEDIEGFLDCLSLTRSVKLVKERMQGQKTAMRAIKKLAKDTAKEQEKADKKAAKLAEREDKRLAKETAKIEGRMAKAQAKLDAKRASLEGVDKAKIAPAVKVESAPVFVMPAKFVAEVPAVAYPTTRHSITLTVPSALPAEVVTRPTFALPEEKLYDTK